MNHMTLSWVLMSFVACVDLNVSLEKSKLGCNEKALPLCYLGLPLGFPFEPTSLWDAVEERFYL